MAHRLQALTVLLCLVLCACARTLVETRPLAEEPARGVVYFLQKKLVKLEVTHGGGVATSATLSVLPAIPDPSQAFVAIPRHRVGSSDEVKVVTTASGLLKAVHTTSRDELPQILEKLAEAAIQGAKLALLFPAADTQAQTEVFTFDPAAASRVQAVSTRLATLGLTLDLRRVGGAGRGLIVPDEGVGGIVYRRSIPYQIDISAQGNRILSEQIVLPNGGPLALIELEGGAFVQTVHDIEFQDGELTLVHSNRPSEVLGAVSILPNMLRQIASIPTELIQFRVNLGGKQEQLARTQRSLIEAEQALIEARRKADEDGAEATGNPIGDGG